MLGGNKFRLRRGFGLRTKHSYGANAPPRRAGPRSCPASIVYGQAKKKDTLQRVFLFGFRRPEAASTLRYFKCPGKMNCPCAKIFAYK